MASWWSSLALQLAPQDNEGPAHAPFVHTLDEQSESRLSPIDATFVARLRAGDRLAFRELFEQHFPSLVEHAATLLKSQVAAEDVVSDIFVSLMEHPARIAPRHSLRAYLVWLVRHRALNRIRGERRAEARHASLAVRNDAAVVPEAAALPDELLEAAERGDARARAIAKALAMLSPRARTIVLFRLRDELEYDDIASVLGMSRSAVKMQLSRALRAIRAELG